MHLRLSLLALSAWVTVRAAPTAQLSLPGHDDVLNPYPTKPKLTFKPNGTFKLTVFSDLHFGENPWDWWGPVQDSNSTRVMKRVLKDEVPDYVVINGDLITGENTFKENSTTLIDEIVAPLNAVKVPFSSSHGNHDNQVNITHEQEIAREQLVAPLSYTRHAPPGVGGVGGPGNYWVPIYKNAAARSPQLVLWFFDSRGGVMTDNTDMPDFVDPSVAQWIESESALMNAAWGPASSRSALAFVHIPPHIVQSLQGDLNSTVDPGLNADQLGTGSTQSTLHTDEFGTDQDAPFWNAVTTHIPNLHAIVSGHDHGNEWCKRSSMPGGLIFCFNKHSGYGGYGDPSWGYGVRNFVFSGDPRAGVDTWIRLEEGEVRAKVRLDAKFE